METRTHGVVSSLMQHGDEIRRLFGVKELFLFGSVVRDEQRLDSDVDLLVAFEDAPTFDRFMDLKFYLEDLLGRRVDLVTRRAIREALRTHIESEAVRVA